MKNWFDIIPPHEDIRSEQFDGIRCRCCPALAHNRSLHALSSGPSASGLLTCVSVGLR